MVTHIGLVTELALALPFVLLVVIPGFSFYCRAYLLSCWSYLWCLYFVNYPCYSLDSYAFCLPPWCCCLWFWDPIVLWIWLSFLLLHKYLAIWSPSPSHHHVPVSSRALPVLHLHVTSLHIYGCPLRDSVNLPCLLCYRTLLASLVFILSLPTSWYSSLHRYYMCRRSSNILHCSLHRSLSSFCSWRL